MQAQLAKVLRAEIGDRVLAATPEQLRSLEEWLHPPIKLELAFNFDVGDNYRQHPIVNIDSRWVVITLKIPQTATFAQSKILLADSTVPPIAWAFGTFGE